MAKIDAIDVPKLTFPEAAAPSTPASGKVVIYAKSDGLMYSKDDAGAEVVMSGGGGGGGTFVGARAYNSTTQTVTAGVETTLTFDSEEYDTSAFHSTVTNTSRLTVPSTGYYRVTAHVGASSTAGGVFARFRVNGTTVVTGSEDDVNGTDVSAYPTAQIQLTAGDYIEVRASRGTGTTFGGTTGSFSNTFEIVLLGT